MGNCISRSAKSEEAGFEEEKYAGAVSSLAAREQELVDTTREFESSKAQERHASDRAEALSKRVEELEAQHNTLQEEREKEASDLKSDLQHKDDEMRAERQAAEKQRAELDEARRRVVQLEGNVKWLDSEKRVLREELEGRLRDMETAAAAKEKELDDTRKATAEDLSAAQKSAEEELRAAKDRAAAEVSAAEKRAREAMSAKVTITAEVWKARDLIASLQKERSDLSTDLDSTKAHLGTALAKLEAQDSTATYASSKETFLEPVRFGFSRNKDIRIQNSWWQGSLGVDIREYWDGGPTKKVSSEWF